MHLLGQQRLIEKDPRTVPFEGSGRGAEWEVKSKLRNSGSLAASKVCRGSALLECLEAQGQALRRNTASCSYQPKSQMTQKHLR